MNAYSTRVHERVRRVKEDSIIQRTTKGRREEGCEEMGMLRHDKHKLTLIALMI